MSFLAGHVHDLSGLGTAGWVIVGVASLFVAWVFWRAVVLTIRPGEEEPDHIKRTILDDDPPVGTRAVHGPVAGGSR